MRVPAFVLFLALFATGSSAEAADVYREPETFLAKAFDADPPDPSILWLSGKSRDVVEEILGHPYRGARLRYWQRDDRTAWILEEIGKHKPITTGLLVRAGELVRIRVLIYRESRGWQVRREFFTEQFKGAKLTEDYRLDRSIDGISGATLSVRALTRLARVALYLHDRVTGQ